MKTSSITTSSPNPRDFLARATRTGKATFAVSVVPKHVKPAVVDVGMARHAYLVTSEAALSKRNALRSAVLISVVPFAVQKDAAAVTTGVITTVTTVLRVARRVVLRTSLRILNLPRRMLSR